MQRLLTGNAREVLRTLPPASIHCCVTSPPYWGLRDYGTGAWVGGDPDCDHKPSSTPGRRGLASSTLTGGQASNGHQREGYRARCPRCGARRVADAQLGMEELHDCLGWATGHPCGACYVCNIVGVFSEVWRVLRDDGTCFLNIDDKFAGHGAAGRLKVKDLALLPQRLALALQAAGWYVRADIIWAKTAPKPDGAQDRPTRSHEYVWLLSKRKRYFWDAVAVMENGGRRNQRGVWLLGPDGYAEAHFATFPRELPRRAILAGTSAHGVCPTCGAPWRRIVERVFVPQEDVTPAKRAKASRKGVDPSSRQGEMPRGITIPKTVGWQPTCSCPPAAPVPATVLDPFVGSGTTLVVAQALGRAGIGIELNPDYVALARRRLDP